MWLCVAPQVAVTEAVLLTCEWWACLWRWRRVRRTGRPPGESSWRCLLSSWRSRWWLPAERKHTHTHTHRHAALWTQTRVQVESSYPDCWVDEEGFLTFGELLHPLRHAAKSERASWNGLIPTQWQNEMYSKQNGHFMAWYHEKTHLAWCVGLKPSSTGV